MSGKRRRKRSWPLGILRNPKGVEYIITTGVGASAKEYDRRKTRQGALSLARKLAKAGKYTAVYRFNGKEYQLDTQCILNRCDDAKKRKAIGHLIFD